MNYFTLTKCIVILYTQNSRRGWLQKMKYIVNVPDFRREIELQGIKTKRALSRNVGGSYRTLHSIMSAAAPAYSIIQKTSEAFNLT